MWCVHASWSGEAAVILFSTRGVINGPSSNDCTQLASCRRFPVTIVLNQPIARPGGKASLVIGSRKYEPKRERNVLLFSRPFCRANSNRRQNGRGHPVYMLVWARPCVLLSGWRATWVVRRCVLSSPRRTETGECCGPSRPRSGRYADTSCSRTCWCSTLGDTHTQVHVHTRTHTHTHDYHLVNIYRYYLVTSQTTVSKAIKCESRASYTTGGHWG